MNKPPAPLPVSLSAWLNIWLRSYAPIRCSLKTLERYSELAMYVVNGATPDLATVAATPLPELRHWALEPALLSLCGQLSTRTVRHIAGMLSSALRKACHLDLIRDNPMRRVELPPVGSVEARSLTAAEIQKLRDRCRGEWTFAFVELALATGCRRGELLALEWSDIDWRNKLVSISKSLEQTRKGLRVKLPKNGRRRVFSLPDVALEALRSMRLHSRSGIIFSRECGRHRRPDLVSQIIARRIRQSGIDGASLHSLRHTHATTLLSEGIPLPAISMRLGHSDPTITARIYTHALPIDDANAAKAWDKLILKAG